MKYRQFKHEKLSLLGFGCLQTRDPDILKTAYQNGVNFFVSAETYGDENQTMLADAFSDTEKKPFFATKVGINFSGHSADEQFIQSRDQIRESVKKCSELLKKTPVDFVGLHRLDDLASHRVYIPGTGYVSAWEIALDELMNLQEAGLIRHIGLSEPTAEQLERALALTRARGTTIAAIESAYSIVTRRAEINGVKEICDQEDIVIMAYSSVIRGLTDPRLLRISLDDFSLPDEQFQQKFFDCLGMTGDIARENVDMFSIEHIKHNARLMLDFHSLAAQYGVTPAQLSLAWIEHKGAIPIPGTNSLDHLMENIQSVDLVDYLEKSGAFEELDKCFPFGTFSGSPNPLTLSKALDSNNSELDLPKERGAAMSSDI
ncbi:aldo/keto reductase [Legionella sp. CNM-4043-24]|uniref:aldo/keto reductase n=1 Tax=Legionella sp. CNM-4043-24 TaxID=3421646 RepID=UPI00403B25B2